ncbi:MAG TPA: fibronectin type III domain-containing protein, partial [Ruminiclostridium sp.]|nr:fibronectin type III domain-containing protein [Ruminiclostridium sp.]
SNIVAKAGDSKIILTWSSVQGATGYDVEVDGNVVYNGTSTAYTHTGLTSGTGHTYRVRAKAAETGDWSQTIRCLTLPPVPASISLTAKDTEITLKWGETPGAEQYEVETDGVIVSGISERIYTHKGLLPSTQHKYRIRAKNSGGVGAWSDYYTKTTPPATPTGLKAVASNDSVTVTWNQAEGATAYDISVDGIIITNIGSLSYIHSSLTPNTKHSYKVRARNSVTAGGWSSVVEVITSLNPPGNITATSQETQITLTWEAVTGAVKYTIEVDGSETGSTSENSYTHTGLIPGTEHSFRIKAENDQASSQWSEVFKKWTVPGSVTGITTSSSYHVNYCLYIVDIINICYTRQQYKDFRKAYCYPDRI